MSAAQYTQGHHESRLKAHAQRTAEKCASYLLPYIQPGHSILDVGCGPGSITVDFGALVGTEGRVFGIEISDEPLVMARELAATRGLQNTIFQVGDIHNLNFPDNTFDIVHVHQVLIHAGNPVHALQELRRVTKPGGIVAAREGDVELSVWYPDSEYLNVWREHCLHTITAAGGDPLAGRKIHDWAHQAGFDWSAITASVDSYLYRSEEDRQFIGSSTATRLEHAALSADIADTAMAERLKRGAQALREWLLKEEGWHVVTNGQILCRK